MMYLMIAGGLLLLFAGGEALVRGSVSVARRLGISELVIGLTLVGFGTSVPELVTSLEAVSKGAVGISVGNVIGSNVANILLVLGVAAILSPILVQPRAIARDGSFMIAVTVLFCALLWFDQFSRPVGIALVVLLAAYLAFSIIADRRRDDPAAEMHEHEGETVEANYGLFLGLTIALAGLIGVVAGANFLVTGSVSLARSFGISETVIGLTIVAIGTSLPELATSIVAALRRKADVAIGNIIGSNIFNILGIIGVTAMVYPFSVRGSPAAEGLARGEPVSLVSMTDISTLILSVLLLVLFAFTGRRLSRWEGGILLGAYVLYMGLIFGLVPAPGGFAYGG
ncbi:calcium/sodium antiporter [Hyphomonas sp.]|uniref:calcium/sodium antiporter n=1 Tax=Hyphomonas sp. TaxID=87 RepID=UPI003919B2B0